jgi:hypothetical protein
MVADQAACGGWRAALTAPGTGAQGTGTATQGTSRNGVPLNREIGSRPKTGDQSRQSGGLTHSVPVMRSLSNTYSNNTSHHRQFRHPNADNFCFRQSLEMIGGAQDCTFGIVCGNRPIGQAWAVTGCDWTASKKA